MSGKETHRFFLPFLVIRFPEQGGVAFPMPERNHVPADFGHDLRTEKMIVQSQFHALFHTEEIQCLFHDCAGNDCSMFQTDIAVGFQIFQICKELPDFRIAGSPVDMRPFGVGKPDAVKQRAFAVKERPNVPRD